MRDDDWQTWPPPTELHAGREYLIRTRTGTQKLDRESRMSYLGDDHGALQFNARPSAGTQAIDPASIIAVLDVGPSAGRDDPRRYCYRVVRPE